MDYIFLALLSSFFASLTIIIMKSILKNIQLEKIISLNFLFLGTISLLLSILDFKISFLPYIWIIILLVMIVDCISNYFYFKALEKLEASYVAIVHTTTPLFGLIFTWIMYPSFITIKVVIAYLGITIGLLILQLNNSLKFEFNFYTIILIFSAIFFAGISVIWKNIFNYLSPPVFYSLRSFLMSIVFYLVFGIHIPKIKLSMKILTRDILVCIKYLLFMYALSIGNPSLVISLSYTAPIFVLIFGYIFFKEKITLKKIVSLSVIIGTIFYVKIF